MSSDAPRSTTSVFLIHDHYRRMGCYIWDRTRFLRLAAAAGFTATELATRVGIESARDLDRCFASGFPRAVGILLTLHERYIRVRLTGYDDGQDLFPPISTPLP